MKMIILAAGRGSRLGSLTDNTPKPLIDLGNGKTLLETQLEAIEESKVIDEIVLVIGYCWDQIEAKMKKYKRNGVKITTIFNPFYEVSNNLMSLWLAKNKMDSDFIVTNGDNIFDKQVFIDLVNKNREGIFLTTNRKQNYNDDDMKLILGEGVERVSKDIPSQDASAESVGLALISGEKSREIFKNNLEELARESEYLNKFWLEVFNRMISKGVFIKTFEIDGSKMWAELDFHMDLKDIIKSLMDGKFKFKSQT